MTRSPRSVNASYGARLRAQRKLKQLGKVPEWDLEEPRPFVLSRKEHRLTAALRETEDGILLGDICSLLGVSERDAHRMLEKLRNAPGNERLVEDQLLFRLVGD